jgi:hypothetical protein
MLSLDGQHLEGSLEHLQMLVRKVSAEAGALGMIFLSVFQTFSNRII